MKRVITILIICLTTKLSLGSETTEFQIYHRTIGPMALMECAANGANISTTTTPISSNVRFAIISDSTNFYIIRILTFKDTTSTNYGLLNVDKSKSNAIRYFKMPKNALGKHTEPLVKKYQGKFGAVVLPFKYRPQTGDVKKDLALTSLGGISRNFFNGALPVTLLIGVGLSSVSIDSTNSASKATVDRAAVTIPIGVILEKDKVQIGLFIGNDYLLNNSIDKWTYNGRHWLSIGIGFSIFSEQKDAKAPDGN